MKSEIKQTSEEISAEVSRAKEAEAEISVRADEIVQFVADLEEQTSGEIKTLSDEISLRVTSDEAQSLIDVTLDNITIEAEQINLNGYVKSGGGNFTIDENGNIRLVTNGSTNTIIEAGDSGVEVSASTSLGAWQTYYGASGITMRSGGDVAARLGIDTNGTLTITTYGGNLLWNGNTVLTSGNFTLDFNSPKTTIEYTSVGNIKVMSANGYMAESDYKYGNIAATGWVQGKVATLNTEISRAFENIAKLDSRLTTLEAKVV